MEDIKTIDLGALRALAKQRSLVMEELFTLVENALLLAYMKQPGAIKGSRAVIDRTTGEFVILAPELDEDNQKIDEFDDTPNNFGRIAAATVRQVLSQRLRDAEDASVLGEFKDREGTLVSGVIQQGNNPRMVQVDLGTVEAVLPSNEQVPGEKYPHGTRLRAYLVEALVRTRTWFCACSSTRFPRSLRAWYPLTPSHVKLVTAPRLLCPRRTRPSTLRAPASAIWVPACVRLLPS